MGFNSGLKGLNNLNDLVLNVLRQHIAKHYFFVIYRVYFNKAYNLVIHACPRHGSWATFILLSHVRAKSEFLTLQNWDWSAKGDNPDRKSSVLQDSWGCAWG